MSNATELQTALTTAVSNAEDDTIQIVQDQAIFVPFGTQIPGFCLESSLAKPLERNEYRFESRFSKLL